MTTIYVGNLPFTATEDEVRSLFERYGKVDSVKLINDRETGRPRGFAFVDMGAGEAQNAIQAFRGRRRWRRGWRRAATLVIVAGRIGGPRAIACLGACQTGSWHPWSPHFFELGGHIHGGRIHGAQAFDAALAAE
jgi:RNA recognition motif-containing protein